MTAPKHCEPCRGLGFIISLRDDGIHAVEKCDECAVFGDDTEAAHVCCDLLARVAALRDVTERWRYDRAAWDAKQGVKAKV